MGRSFRRSLPSHCCLPQLSFPTVRKYVVGIACAHHTSASERKCHARGIKSDPATTPLFCNGGSGAGTTSRIKHKIAGVGCHKDTAFDDLRVRLNDVDFIFSERTSACVSP